MTRPRSLSEAVDITSDRELELNVAHAASGAMLTGAGILLATQDDSERARGAAGALLSVGAVQLITGVLFMVLRERQREDLHRHIAEDPAAVIGGELARTAELEDAFFWIQAAEVLAIGSGMAMTFAGALQREELVFGIGGGLAMSASAVFTIDTQAKRAMEHHRSYLLRIAPTPR